MNRDHYVAQFHLKQWIPADSKDGQLYKYHVEHGLVDRFPVADLAQEPDFYPDPIERRMADIERQARWALVDICNGGRPRSGKRMSELLDYVAMTVARSPFRLREWKEYLTETSREYPEHADVWEEELRHETICASIFERFFPRIRPALNSLAWGPFRPPVGEPLLIADNPTIFIPYGPAGRPNRGSYVLMPLGPGVALLGCKNPRFMSKLLQFENWVNIMSFARADEHVFSSEPIPNFEALQAARRNFWTVGPGGPAGVEPWRHKASAPRRVLRRR